MIIPRCNAKQMNAGLMLLACRNSVASVMDDIPERVNAAGIYDQLQKIFRELDECSEKIIATFPADKIPAMQNLLKKLYLEMTLKSRTPEYGYTSIRTDVLDTLVIKAHENCKICITPDKCNRCDLGKAIDRCTPEERKSGESWADIWI